VAVYRAGVYRAGVYRAGVALNLGAVALYAERHRQLLLIGQLRIPVPAVQGITFAQNSITNTVPIVGGAGALGYAITRLRRWGADPALALVGGPTGRPAHHLWLLVLGAARGWRWPDGCPRPLPLSWSLRSSSAAQRDGCC
jgi:uncharacterized membrane protein YbhN (UPF0104 family)